MWVDRINQAIEASSLNTSGKVLPRKSTVSFSDTVDVDPMNSRTDRTDTNPREGLLQVSTSKSPLNYSPGPISAVSAATIDAQAVSTTTNIPTVLRPPPPASSSKDDIQISSPHLSDFQSPPSPVAILPDKATNATTNMRPSLSPNTVKSSTLSAVPAILEGFVWKRADNSKVRLSNSWKKRYLRLTVDNLSYAENEVDVLDISKLKGNVRIDSTLICALNNEDNCFGNHFQNRII
jgi:hypothetical protein